MPDRAVRYASQFKSDLKRATSHRKCDVATLRQAMIDLAARVALLPALQDHPLRGRYPNQRGGDTDCRECHTSNDWLLVYRFPDEDSVIFIRTGTHSDLF
ncbi:MAG: type II toxin-antitoxin system YafQ family toxin [Dokdonella sp.]